MTWIEPIYDRKRSDIESLTSKAFFNAADRNRIEGNLEPLIRQSRLVLNADERENPHMKRLEEQFLLLNRQMKSPADGPDCIEGGVWIINQKISTLGEGSYTIGRRHHASKRF